MLGIGCLVGLMGLWLDGWSAEPLSLWVSDGPAATMPAFLMAEAGYLSFFAIGLFAMRWWRLTERRRSAWFSLFPVLAAGFWGLGLLCVWPWYTNTPVFGHGSNPPYGLVALVMAAAIVQWSSPWLPPVPTLPKRLRLRTAS